MRTVAIISGGMDSTTLAYQLANGGDDLFLLSFDYGQKHHCELDYAERTASKLGCRHDIIDLRKLGELLPSSLTDPEGQIPEGHYAAENMSATVVPNRNAIMLSIAFGVAVSRKASRVAFGVHAGDHFIYPDCRPQFVKAFDLMESLATEGFGQPELIAPYVNITKADICTIGSTNGVPWGDTWSCYKGESEHCGRCGTCVERKEAFRIAQVVDPTPYEDESYEIEVYRGS